MYVLTCERDGCTAVCKEGYVMCPVHEEDPTAPAAFVGLPDGDGYVYIVRFGDFVKIGYAKDLAMRLRQVPHEEVLATFQATRRTEKKLHDLFQPYRAKMAPGCILREWFHHVPEIDDWIENPDLQLECALEVCSRPVYAKELCERHYRQEHRAITKKVEVRSVDRNGDVAF